MDFIDLARHHRDADYITHREYPLKFRRCIHISRVPRFESCIQQRKTTCLLSSRKSLACAWASKLTTNIYLCPQHFLADVAFWCSICQIPTFKYRDLLIGNHSVNGDNYQLDFNMIFTTVFARMARSNGSIYKCIQIRTYIYCRKDGSFCVRYG